MRAPSRLARLFHHRSDRARTTRRPHRDRLLLEALEGRTLLAATPTMIALDVGAAAAVHGQPITLTAHVSAVPPGSPTPTGGTVTFTSGGDTLGTVALVDGVAALTTSALPVGTNRVSAVYSGDADFASSVFGSISTIAGNGTAGYSGDGGPAIDAALMYPAGLALGAGGDLFFSDSGNHVVREVKADGTILTVAGNGTAGYSGDGGPATSAQLYSPQGLALDGQGNLFIADGGVIREVKTDGTIATVANGFSGATGVAVDAQGNLFVADSIGGRIYEVKTDGTKIIVAGTGNTYFADGDGGPATKAAIGQPADVELDPEGGFYLVDDQDGLMRKVDAAGIISTVAGGGTQPDVAYFGPARKVEIGFPYAVATAPDGTLFIGDLNKNVVCELTPDGNIITVAGSGVTGYSGDGGPATNAALHTPSGVAVDAQGHLFIADTNNNRIREVTYALLVTVDPAATTTALAAPASAPLGQPVTFTATVAADAPSTDTPAGSVTFKDGATVLGTVPLDEHGVATLSVSTLTLGAHAITASYAGNAGDLPSSDGPVTLNIVAQASTTTLVSSANPSLLGQLVTFTATVAAASQGAGTPTGTVTFKDGTIVLGTGPLDGSGVATFTTSALAVGTHAITASYGGDATFAVSTSSPLGQAVQRATATALASSANPSAVGQSVTLTATVSVLAPATGTPAGTVTFKDGAIVLGTVALDGTGEAALTTSALAVGTHAITAVYGGDANDQPSTSPALSQVVRQAATATALTSSANPSVYGQSVTFTATVSVSAPGKGIPTGTVTFFDGSAKIGTAPLNGSGKAIFSTKGLGVGTHTITASYGGDARFTASRSTALPQVVNRSGSQTTVASSTNPSVFGQPVTLTAHVVARSPGGGIPGSSVTFKDGTRVLGTVALNASGVARLTTSALAAGAHGITAVYSGGPRYNPSTSAVITQRVNPAATRTTLAALPTFARRGRLITLTTAVIPVAPGAGTPAGTVTFRDRGVVIGTVPLVRGTATLQTRFWIRGWHLVTASYNGSQNDLRSSSPAVAIAIFA